MNQTLRIIGGKFRGKKWHFPVIEDLRPTPNRVRETLFNWLMHDIDDTHCLDAYAGSGALGLEAYSRGAATVTFIENHPLAYLNLKKMIELFGSKHHLSVIKQDALSYVKRVGGKMSFDIVFLDPPFKLNCLPTWMKLLSDLTVLKKGGLIYLESPQEINIDTLNWQKLKCKQAGEVCYGLYQKR